MSSKNAGLRDDVKIMIAGVDLRAVDNLGVTTSGEKAALFGEYGLVDTFDIGHRIADTMGSHNVIVLKGHGNLVAGGSIQEACVSAIWAEKSARLQYQSMTIGKPQWYPKHEIKKIQKVASYQFDSLRVNPISFILTVTSLLISNCVLPNSESTFFS